MAVSKDVGKELRELKFNRRIKKIIRGIKSMEVKEDLWKVSSSFEDLYHDVSRLSFNQGMYARIFMESDDERTSDLMTRMVALQQSISLEFYSLKQELGLKFDDIDRLSAIRRLNKTKDTFDRLKVLVVKFDKYMSRDVGVF